MQLKPLYRIMMKRWGIVSCALLLLGALASCTASEAVRAGRLISTGNVQGAGVWAAEKGTRYAANPKLIEADIKRFHARLKSFRDTIRDVWGKDEAEEPTPKKYVKYTKNYKSRALVDFDAGTLTVETLDTKAPQQSLEQAIITALLTPYDPRGLDLWSDKEIRLEGEPFLYKEVRDHQGKDIRWAWRAERFAKHLVASEQWTRTVTVSGKKQTVYGVTVPMVADHLKVRARKYQPTVRKWTKKYDVSPSLVYAIMKTESDFNPWAVSHIPAFGLMQVVPKTAGADVAGYLHGKKQPPSSDFLYNPTNNIQYGTVYLRMLDTRYLAGISNAVSREHCVIAAYNGGAGAVLRSFDRDRKKAVQKINRLSPAAVYEHLRYKLPMQETRRYVYKVANARKEFINFR